MKIIKLEQVYHTREDGTMVVKSEISNESDELVVVEDHGDKCLKQNIFTVKRLQKIKSYRALIGKITHYKIVSTSSVVTQCKDWRLRLEIHKDRMARADQYI